MRCQRGLIGWQALKQKAAPQGPHCRRGGRHLLTQQLIDRPLSFGDCIAKLVAEAGDFGVSILCGLLQGLDTMLERPFPLRRLHGRHGRERRPAPTNMLRVRRFHRI